MLFLPEENIDVGQGLVEYMLILLLVGIGEILAILLSLGTIIDNVSSTIVEGL